MRRVNLRLVSQNKEAQAVAASTPVLSARFAGAKSLAHKVFTRGKRVASFGFRVLRYMVFYPLMWLRMVVCFVCHLATVGLLIAWLLGLLLIPETSIHRSTVLWALGGGSFVAFCIGWLYDGLLLFLSPEPIFLDGRRSDY